MAERRVLAVTGASSGIGRALARQAARAGFAVVAIARRAERLAQLEADIVAAGGACAILAMDVRDARAPAAILAAALQRFGRLDVLVHNAGMGAPGTLLAQTDAAIEAQWQTHVAAPIRITREALPALRASRGQIFLVGSGLARVPAPGYGAYCAAKAAVRAAATQLRRELRADGIAVTYVDPGIADTEFAEVSGTPRISPASFAVPAERVASHILRAIASRPARVNAVPWQTAAVTLGEWFPRLADLAMPAPPATLPEPASASSTPEPATPAPANDLELALAPVARRMERVNLPLAFVAELLQPGTELQLSEVAMRWAGMPNKNERAAMAEVLETLAGAGFLARAGEERWRVLRAPGQAALELFDADRREEQHRGD